MNEKHEQKSPDDKRPAQVLLSRSQRLRKIVIELKEIREELKARAKTPPPGAIDAVRVAAIAASIARKLLRGLCPNLPVPQLAELLKVLTSMNDMCDDDDAGEGANAELGRPEGDPSSTKSKTAPKKTRPGREEDEMPI